MALGLSAEHLSLRPEHRQYLVNGELNISQQEKERQPAVVWKSGPESPVLIRHGPRETLLGGGGSFKWSLKGDIRSLVP